MRFQKSGGGGEYVLASHGRGKHASANTQKLQQTYLSEARKKVEKMKDYFDDDDEEEEEGGGLAPVAEQQEQKQREEEEDELDPLDAYMSMVKQKVEKQKETEGKEEERPEIVSGLEGELDEYIPQVNAAAENDLDPEYEYDSDGLPMGRVPPDKKKIEPLPAVDHSQIQYPAFRKNFYSQHANVTALTEAEVAVYRTELEVAVSGTSVPRPIRSFMEAGFNDKLLREIVKHGFEAPTAIQAQALSAALSGRDVVGIAKTGSGKTLGFVWPIIVHALDQPPLQPHDGPIALILAPTRELAAQIYTEARKFARPFSMKVCAIFGGAGKYEMKKALADGPEIVVATPGRFIEMIKGKATNLLRCTILVLDEADRMFEMGFEYQMRSIVNNVRPDRQIMMFSATFKKKVEGLAQDILKVILRVCGDTCLMLGTTGPR
jgi:ATP-dependent RNA helicase DDX42